MYLHQTKIKVLEDQRHLPVFVIQRKRFEKKIFEYQNYKLSSSAIE
jgi:hypothetical protein